MLLLLPATEEVEGETENSYEQVVVAEDDGDDINEDGIELADIECADDEADEEFAGIEDGDEGVNRGPHEDGPLPGRRFS
jgi:hypothetical protein